VTFYALYAAGVVSRRISPALDAQCRWEAALLGALALAYATATSLQPGHSKGCRWRFPGHARRFITCVAASAGYG
jgi:hypothetical protein